MKDLSKSHLSLDFLIFLFKVLFTAKARKERGIHFFFVTESGIPFEFQLKSCRIIHSLLLSSSRPFGGHHFFFVMQIVQMKFHFHSLLSRKKLEELRC